MKALIWDLLAPRARKVLLWIGGLVVLYAVVGFLILPPIIRSVAVKQISRQLNREASIASVKVNPFVLSVTVNGLLIKDTDGEPFVSWDEVYVNFQLASFFGKAWVFKEISTSKPFVSVRMNKDGTFNFSDILAKFSTNAPAAPAKANKPGEPLILHVERLHIGRASAALADFTTREPFKRTVGPLDISLDNFRTDPDNKNPYSFTGTTDAGEMISWSGFFYLDPLRSEGELKLFNFTLNKYVPLYQDLVRFQIRSGSVALDTKYHLEMSATNRITAVEDSAFALRDLKLGVPGDSNNIVDLPLFSVTGANVDLQNRTASIDWVNLAGAKLFLNRDKDAAVNVVELSKPSASATNAPGGILFLLRSVTNAVALLLNSTNEWSGTVRNIAVTNCSLHLEDYVNARPAKLDLNDITLDAKNLSNLAGTNLAANFSLRWNTNGAIHVNTTAGFQPMTANVQMDLDHLDLTTFDSYLAPKIDLFILGSEVNLHGLVRLRSQVNGLPVVSFHGDSSLENFHTVDGAFGEDLVTWDALRFKGINANLNPPLIAISEIDVDNAYARVIIETNNTINLLNVLKLTNTNAPAATDTKPVVAEKSPASAAASTNSVMQISIDAIVITNTAIRFSDRSLTPDVNLSIQAVNGSITGLSTEDLQHAIVDLHAKVDGVGPVAISGTINPLNGAQTNTIKISVKDVDLTPTSPYSGKFTGYGISEGKLNLDLDYELVGKKLTAKNVITLDQFNFGEKVDSKEATHLPVRLAIALLKDREGKIVLDVPVEGDLSDPKFRIGKVVMRVIVNILEKVATSPFSLLGAAFGGGGEELGYQDFAPGSAELTVPDKAKLDSLAKALAARPALKLEISGSIDPAGDHEGLQRAALDREIRTRKWMKLRKAEQATNSVEHLVLSPNDCAHYVKKFYNEALADKKITPELFKANTNLAAYAAQVLPHRVTAQKGAQLLRSATLATTTTPKGAAAPVTKLVPPPDPMEAVLLATFPIGDADLATLAARRAKAAQKYLIETGKVSAGRLFFKNAAPDSLRHDGSRAYLQFQ
jgi:hypothetical protein